MKKGLAKNFQPLRAKRAQMKTTETIAINVTYHIMQYLKQKTRECASKAPPQANAAIKLQTGQAPSRLPGVKGAGSPLAQNLSSLK